MKILKIFLVLIVLAVLIVGGWLTYEKFLKQKESTETTFDFPIIDAHSHLSWNRTLGETVTAALAVATSTTKKNQVAFTIILPPPFVESMPGKFDLDELKNISNDSFGFGAGGGSLNVMIQSTPTDQVTEEIKTKFQTTAEQIIDAGALVLGETAALHFSLYGGHPFEETLPNHPLFLELADIAAEHNIPVDLHMEAVPDDMTTPQKLLSASSNNPTTISANIPALEELLDHNKSAKIIWDHAGWDNTGERTVALMRDLLTKHANLYMSFREGDTGGLPQNRPLDSEGKLKDEWLKLFTNFSDRFVIGGDVFFSTPNTKTADLPGKFDNEIKILEQLPTEVAEEVAYKNAIKLFNLDLELP